jgi:hypothetical protein
MKARLLLPVLLLFAGTAFAQVSVGVKAGVPVTDFFETGALPGIQYFTDTHRYTIGPTVEIHLPKGLSVEVDALYKRLDYSATLITLPLTFSSATANSWEFPVLLKYRAGHKGVLRPFLDTGASFHSISGFGQLGNIIRPSQLVKDFNGGWVVGGGLDLHILLHLEPELRYTRWFSNNFQDTTGALASNRNQVEFLVGFRF